MTGVPSRSDRILQRVALGVSVLFFVLIFLHIFVAAHPTGASPALLPLALAMVCASGAPMLQSPIFRRILLVASILLVVTAGWWL